MIEKDNDQDFFQKQTVITWKFFKQASTEKKLDKKFNFWDVPRQ